MKHACRMAEDTRRFFDVNETQAVEIASNC